MASPMPALQLVRSSCSRKKTTYSACARAPCGMGGGGESGNGRDRRGSPRDPYSSCIEKLNGRARPTQEIPKPITHADAQALHAPRQCTRGPPSMFESPCIGRRTRRPRGAARCSPAKTAETPRTSCPRRRLTPTPAAAPAPRPPEADLSRTEPASLEASRNPFQRC